MISDLIGPVVLIVLIFFWSLVEGVMDELIIEMTKKFTDQIKKFLKASKAEGDVTIDDVLKRLESLKKET